MKKIVFFSQKNSFFHHENLKWQKCNEDWQLIFLNRRKKSCSFYSKDLVFEDENQIFFSEILLFFAEEEFAVNKFVFCVEDKEIQQ